MTDLPSNLIANEAGAPKQVHRQVVTEITQQDELQELSFHQHQFLRVKIQNENQFSELWFKSGGVSKTDDQPSRRAWTDAN